MRCATMFHCSRFRAEGAARTRTALSSGWRRPSANAQSGGGTNGNDARTASRRARSIKRAKAVRHIGGTRRCRKSRAPGHDPRVCRRQHGALLAMPPVRQIADTYGVPSWPGDSSRRRLRLSRCPWRALRARAWRLRSARLARLPPGGWRRDGHRRRSAQDSVRG